MILLSFPDISFIIYFSILRDLELNLGYTLQFSLMYRLLIVHVVKEEHHNGFNLEEIVKHFKHNSET